MTPNDEARDRDESAAGDNDLVMLRGLEILREWLAEPEAGEPAGGASDPKCEDVVAVQHD